MILKLSGKAGGMKAKQGTLRNQKSFLIDTLSRSSVFKAVVILRQNFRITSATIYVHGNGDLLLG